MVKSAIRVAKWIGGGVIICVVLGVALEATAPLSGTWVIEHRPPGTVKTLMRSGEWVEVREYNADDALVTRHWRDSQDRPNVATYDPNTGNEVSREVMQ